MSSARQARAGRQETDWHPGLAWLVGVRREESRELRQARLRTLPDEWILLLAEVAWIQIGGWYTLALTGQAWVFPWLITDAALQLIRIRLKRAHQRAVAAQLTPPHQAMVVVNCLWFILMAAGIGAMMRIGEHRLLVIATVLSVGFGGYIASRYAAFPRLGAALLYLLGGSATLVLLLSPTMWIVGILLPGAPVALQLLLRQNHAILVEALTALEQNLHLSMHDPLTGLPNRLALWRDMEALVNHLDRDQRYTFAVLCLDLDGFKPVNDRYGHSGGDWLLKSIADRLRACVREDDLVCRIGGDEFVVLLPGGDEDSAVQAAQRLIEVCIQPHDLGRAAKARVGLSVGIAVAPVHGRTGDELLTHADTALYTSKRGTKGGWTVHLTPVS